MDNNIYKTPESDLGDALQITIPENIRKKIKAGWIAAVISGVMTLVISLVAMNAASDGLFGAWSLIDVALLFALAYGIYLKSRFAATFMLVYFLLSKILIMVEAGRPSGIILSLVFLYFYFQAMMGAYQYHNFLKTRTAQSVE